MIEITTTAESMEQAQALLDAGVDTLYIGEATFGLRLPRSFSRAEQRELVKLAHAQGKKITIAVNGIMHPEQMKLIPEYLRFLKEIGVDQITVGDPGIFFVMQRDQLDIPVIYDGATLVTSSRQINFWGEHGAIGAVVAREIPYAELVEMAENLQIFGEILVYGATCIHQSKRPLLQNYYAYTDMNESPDKERDLFLSEPKETDTHYSIYEDNHGTHVFANNDVDLLSVLDQLITADYRHWKLDGLYTPGAAFVQVAACFVKAKELLETGQWTEAAAAHLDQQVRALHPEKRGLDLGFFAIDPAEIK